MLTIIADAMMTATRTDKSSSNADYYSGENRRHQFRMEQRRRDAKRQMRAAVGQGMW
jgi:hypothetical protein